MKLPGTTQASVLKALDEHHSWHRGGAWKWDTWSGTERVMKSLAREGWADVTEARPGVSDTYTITDTGREALRRHTEKVAAEYREARVIGSVLRP